MERIESNKLDLKRHTESFRANLPFLFDDKLKALARATSQQHRLAWLAGKLPDPYFPPSDSLSSSVFPCDEFLTPEDKVVLDSLQVNQSHADPQRASPSPHPQTPPSPSPSSPSLSPDLGTVSSPRILCLIYTISPSHSRVRGVAQTWGKRCDGFLALSNQSDPRNGILNVRPAFQDWEEQYHEMWPKVQAIWRFVAGTLSGEFDFFLIGGDDLYVIVENLRAYLSSEELAGVIRRKLHRKKLLEAQVPHQSRPHIEQNIEEVVSSTDFFQSVPLYLGRILHQNEYLTYQSGGAGYVLNRAALIELVSHLSDPSCLAPVSSSMEDVLTGRCLRQAGVYPTETARRTRRSSIQPQPTPPTSIFTLKSHHSTSHSSTLRFYQHPQRLLTKEINSRFRLEHSASLSLPLPLFGSVSDVDSNQVLSEIKTKKGSPSLRSSTMIQWDYCDVDIHEFTPLTRSNSSNMSHLDSSTSTSSSSSLWRCLDDKEEEFLLHRFHPLGPGEVYSLSPHPLSYPAHQGNTNTSSSSFDSTSSTSQSLPLDSSFPPPPTNPLEWFPRMSDSFSSGLGCCSRDSVSFQNVKGEHYQRCLHHRLYNRYEGR